MSVQVFTPDQVIHLTDGEVAALEGQLLRQLRREPVTSRKGVSGAAAYLGSQLSPDLRWKVDERVVAWHLVALEQRGEVSMASDDAGRAVITIVGDNSARREDSDKDKANNGSRRLRSCPRPAHTGRRR